MLSHQSHLVGILTTHLSNYFLSYFLEVLVSSFFLVSKNSTSDKIISFEQTFSPFSFVQLLFLSLPFTRTLSPLLQYFSMHSAIAPKEVTLKKSVSQLPSASFLDALSLTAKLKLKTQETSLPFVLQFPFSTEEILHN